MLKKNALFLRVGFPYLAHGDSQCSGGRLFGASAVFFFLQKRPFFGKEKSQNRSEGAKSIVLLRATNGPLTKSGVILQKNFGPKKSVQFLMDIMF